MINCVIRSLSSQRASPNYQSSTVLISWQTPEPTSARWPAFTIVEVFPPHVPTMSNIPSISNFTAWHPAYLHLPTFNRYAKCHEQQSTRPVLSDGPAHYAPLDHRLGVPSVQAHRFIGWQHTGFFSPLYSAASVLLPNYRPR